VWQRLQPVADIKLNRLRHTSPAKAGATGQLAGRSTKFVQRIRCVFNGNNPALQQRSSA
jgi:hypothetical protein